MSFPPRRTRTQPRFFRALPAYLGGKRRLCPLIFSLIADELHRAGWPGSTLLDPVSGGGAVALFAKAQGFSVVASDIAERAVVVTRAVVANSSVRLRREDVLDLFREPDGSYPRIAARQVPLVFSADQAQWLDRAVAGARRRSEPIRSLLLLVVIKVALRCQPMSLLTATDAEAAVGGDFDRVSPRRLGHYLRAQQRLLTPDGAWRIAERINAGVIGGRGDARRADAPRAIAETGADVLYLDPPYPGTSRYDREYAVLDELLGDEPRERAPPTLDELLTAARHIPLVVLSYGGPTVTLDDLVATVGAQRRVVRALAVPYPHLRSIASKEKNDANREFIVVARN